VFIEAKDDGGGGDNWSYKSCKPPVKSSPPTNQHPSCHPTNSVKALKGKISHSMDLLPQAHMGVFQLCLRPLIATGYLGGELPCLSRLYVLPYSALIYAVAFAFSSNNR